MTERSEGDEPTEGLPRPYIPESPPTAPVSPPPPPPPPLPGQYGHDAAPPPPPPGPYPPVQYPPTQYPPGQYPPGSSLPDPSAPAWTSDQYPAMAYQPGVTYGGGGTDGMAIASMVCGIVGYVTCGPFVHIPGVILGHMSRRRIAASNGRLGGSGMATAGLVLSYVGLALVAAYFLVLIVIFGARSS